MLYAKVVNNSVVKYPISETDIRIENPNTSFPEGPWPSRLMEAYDCYPVTITPKPDYDYTVNKLVELAPVKNMNTWTQVWDLVPLTKEEKQDQFLRTQQSLISSTQQRLDNFAKTRNYDNILGLCTYATATNKKFQMEAQHGIKMRDATWTKLYEILDQIEVANRPLSTKFTDIEAELPDLQWPT